MKAPGTSHSRPTVLTMKHPINHDCNQAVELACDMPIMSFNIVIKVTVTAKYMPSLFNVSCCSPFFVLHGVHLHLQSGQQSRFALPQVQLELSPLQEHLVNSVHDLESCGIVIKTGTHEWLWYLVYANSVEKEPLGLLAFVRWSSWYMLLTSWISTSLEGGSLSIARFFLQNSPFLPHWHSSKDLFCRRG